MTTAANKFTALRKCAQRCMVLMRELQLELELAEHEYELTGADVSDPATVKLAHPEGWKSDGGLAGGGRLL